MTEIDLYWYQCRVVSNYDGDTITVDQDFGCSVVIHNRVLRFAGVDTPEIRGKTSWIDDEMEAKRLGRRAKDRVATCCPVGSEILIRTKRDKGGKYGRLLALIYAPTELMVTENVAGPEVVVTFDGKSYGQVDAWLLAQGLGRVPPW